MQYMFNHDSSWLDADKESLNAIFKYHIQSKFASTDISISYLTVYSMYYNTDLYSVLLFPLIFNKSRAGRDRKQS